MKTAGIVGGLGPESTVYYYQGIIGEYKRRTKRDNSPNINIVSIDMAELIGCFETRDYGHIIEMLGAAIVRLARAGSDFAVISANTPHLFFDRLSREAPIEMISIVDATSGRIALEGYKNALLTGTLFTMRENFYAESASEYGIDIIVPQPADMQAIYDVIVPELEEGIIVPEKKARYIEIVNKYIEAQDIDCVILGCTELPLMIAETDLPIPVINPCRVHIEKIVDRLLEK
jgi:aspartate racemase